jgi:hypothetical protein
MISILESIKIHVPYKHKVRIQVIFIAIVFLTEMSFYKAI